MQQPLLRRATLASTALVVALVVFLCGVVTGRSSAQERGDTPSPSTTVAAATPAAATQTPQAMPHVIIYGDSLVTQAEPYLQIVSRALGLEVEARAIGGTAPCDFVPRIQEDIAAKRIDLAVWAFSGNSVGSCMLGADGKPVGGQAMFDRYHDDTEQAIEAAEAANVPFVLASPPAPHLPGDVWEQLDSVYRLLAASHPRIQYADAGVAISPVGEFVDTQRCLPFEQRIPQAREACDAADGVITVRGSDGHFCPVSTTTGSLECTTYSSGAMRYAINLLQAARLELDYQAQVAAGAIPPP
jgi:hypothetical protein